MNPQESHVRSQANNSNALLKMCCQPKNVAKVTAQTFSLLSLLGSLYLVRNMYFMVAITGKQVLYVYTSDDLPTMTDVVEINTNNVPNGANSKMVE